MKSLKKLLILGALVIFMTSCANNETSANQYSLKLNTLLGETMGKRQACLKAVEELPEAKYVRSNLIYSEPDAPNKFELLSSTKKVAQEDKKMLLVFLSNRQPCYGDSLKSLQAIYPPFANIQASLMQKSDSIYAKLMSGQITIGEANQAIQEGLSAYKKEWSAETVALNTRIQNDHNAELQNRYARTMIYQNMINNLGTLQSPTMTNCQKIGGSVNCVSQ
jgi:hypothetical protein